MIITNYLILAIITICCNLLLKIVLQKMKYSFDKNEFIIIDAFCVNTMTAIGMILHHFMQVFNHFRMNQKSI